MRDTASRGFPAARLCGFAHRDGRLPCAPRGCLARARGSGSPTPAARLARARRPAIRGPVVGALASGSPLVVYSPCAARRSGWLALLLGGALARLHARHLAPSACVGWGTAGVYGPCSPSWSAATDGALFVGLDMDGAHGPCRATPQDGPRAPGARERQKQSHRARAPVQSFFTKSPLAQDGQGGLCVTAGAHTPTAPLLPLP